MEKWFRAIEMQADYARGGDGTSMLSNPTQPTVPKKRIRQSHSLLFELDRATKALDELERGVHEIVVAEDDAEPVAPGSACITPQDAQISHREAPSRPQNQSNDDNTTTRVQKISSRSFNPRLDVSFEESVESIDAEDIPVRVRSGRSGRSNGAPDTRRTDYGRPGDDCYDGENSKARVNGIRMPSPKVVTKDPPRSGWI